MVKSIKTSFQQLKDSQILYAQNPPAFMIWLLIILAFLLAFTIVWGNYTTKIYVIRSPGTVVSTNRNYIMSTYTGKISHAVVSSGDFVKKGDVLFHIASTELDIQETQIEELIEGNREKIQQYTRLEQCIKDGINLFDENDLADKAYYYQYETYMNQVRQKEIDLSAYKAYDYTPEQIQNIIQVNEAAIAEIYYSTLKSIAEAVRSLQAEIESYEAQLVSIRSGQLEYPITASTSGIVHMDTEYKAGMVVQAGTAIGSIVAENEAYTARVYTSANDMPLIHVGDRVDVAVSGLTQTIYGTIGGRVSYIASEATVNEKDGSSSFLVEIDLDSVYLVSNQGNKVNLSNGMAVEARIQYDEVTYFNYMLEALGVLTR